MKILNQYSIVIIIIVIVIVIVVIIIIILSVCLTILVSEIYLHHTFYVKS